MADIKSIIEDAGGKVVDIGTLPDGSGFAAASFQLPKDHWIYGADEDGYTRAPPMPFRMGADDPRRENFNRMVRDAARYAIQASTMRGQDIDFDPDAMVQNFVVGLLGYHTVDGLSGETFGNPSPIPPMFLASLERESGENGTPNVTPPAERSEAPT